MNVKKSLVTLGLVGNSYEVNQFLEQIYQNILQNLVLKNTVCGYLADSMGNRNGVVERKYNWKSPKPGGYETELDLANACIEIDNPLYVSGSVDLEGMDFWFPKNIYENFNIEEVKQWVETCRCLGEKGIVEILPGNQIGRKMYKERSEDGNGEIVDNWFDINNFSFSFPLYMRERKNNN